MLVIKQILNHRASIYQEFCFKLWPGLSLLEHNYEKVKPSFNTQQEEQKKYKNENSWKSKGERK